jgi:hypothetical protein
MRQWGQKLNKDLYMLLGLGMMVLVEQEYNIINSIIESN